LWVIIIVSTSASKLVPKFVLVPRTRTRTWYEVRVRAKKWGRYEVRALQNAQKFRLRRSKLMKLEDL